MGSGADLWSRLRLALDPVPAPTRETAEFRGLSHDELCRGLSQWLRGIEPFLGDNLQVTVTHSLQDAGVDVVLDAIGCQTKLGIQVKSDGDVESRTFAADVKRQITESRQHGLEGLAVVICADANGKSREQKIGGLLSELSRTGDTYVAAVPPAFALSVWRQMQSGVDIAALRDRYASTRFAADTYREALSLEAHRRAAGTAARTLRGGERLDGIQGGTDSAPPAGLVEALSRWPVVWLVGPSGSGKTTVVWQAVRDLASGPAAAGGARDAVPVYVDLQMLGPSGLAGLLDTACAAGQPAVRDGACTVVLERGAAVFWDNVARLPTGAHRQVFGEIAALAMRHSASRHVIVAQRKEFYDATDHIAFELGPLSDGEIVVLVEGALVGAPERAQVLRELHDPTHTALRMSVQAMAAWLDARTHGRHVAPNPAHAVAAQVGTAMARAAVGANEALVRASATNIARAAARSHAAVPWTDAVECVRSVMHGLGTGHEPPVGAPNDVLEALRAAGLIERQGEACAFAHESYMHCLVGGDMATTWRPGASWEGALPAALGWCASLSKQTDQCWAAAQALLEDDVAAFAGWLGIDAPHDGSGPTATVSSAFAEQYFGAAQQASAAVLRWLPCAVQPGHPDGCGWYARLDADGTRGVACLVPSPPRRVSVARGGPLPPAAALLVAFDATELRRRTPAQFAFHYMCRLALSRLRASSVDPRWGVAALLRPFRPTVSLPPGTLLSWRPGQLVELVRRYLGLYIEAYHGLAASLLAGTAGQLALPGDGPLLAFAEVHPASDGTDAYVVQALTRSPRAEDEVHVFAAGQTGYRLAGPTGASGRAMLALDTPPCDIALAVERISVQDLLRDGPGLLARDRLTAGLTDLVGSDVTRTLRYFAGVRQVYADREPVIHVSVGPSQADLQRRWAK